MNCQLWTVGFRYRLHNLEPLVLASPVALRNRLVSPRIMASVVFFVIPFPLLVGIGI